MRTFLLILLFLGMTSCDTVEQREIRKGKKIIEYQESIGKKELLDFLNKNPDFDF